MPEITQVTVAGTSSPLLLTRQANGSTAFADTLDQTLAALTATPEEERAFARDLTQRFKAAGIDTSKPIELTVDSSGAVIAKDGTADKDKIDALFAGDFTLANTYRKVASTEMSHAMATEYQPYSADYQAAGSDAARGSVWRSYIGTFNAIGAAGGDLTLNNGTLSSRAEEIAEASVEARRQNGLPAGLVAQIERSNYDSLMEAC